MIMNIVNVMDIGLGLPLVLGRGRVVEKIREEEDKEESANIKWVDRLQSSSSSKQEKAAKAGTVERERESS